METQTLKELMDILENETRVYEGILRLSKDKTKILVDGKVSELEKLVKLEQALVIQAGRLESSREDLTARLAGELGLEPQGLTVSELAKHLKNREAEKFSACRERLAGVIGELRNTNELNARLIKNSLDYINFSINMLADVGTVNNSYGSAGLMPGPMKRSFFDRKL